MSRYEFIISLIELVGEYEQSEGKVPANITDFNSWLSYKTSLYDRVSPSRKKYKEKDNFNSEQSIEAVISRQVSALYKFAKHYSKKVLYDTPLNSVDEFGFLASLTAGGDFSKTELINMNLLEVTSGTEIIKRLIRKGYASEFKDPNDGRGKRVRITKKGLGVIVGIFNKMSHVADLVAGNLSDFEKHQLTKIMSKLERFHHVIHENDRQTKVDDICEKYLPGE